MINPLSAIQSVWRNDKLQLVIIAYFIFVYSWVYRVALRAMMDGSPFRWVNVLNTQILGQDKRAYIAGNGTDGHFVVVLLMAILFGALLYLMIRRPDRFTRWLLLFFSSAFLLSELTVAIGLGDSYVIRGDTFGVAIPYYIIGPIEKGVMVVLAILWLVNFKVPHDVEAALLPNQMKLLRYLLITVPVLYLLLHSGAQNGLTDKLGIILMYTQLLLAVLALMPMNVRRVPG